ncbi:MAG: PKD domain-containing protein, partial [Bacteroidota bacterium]
MKKIKLFLWIAFAAVTNSFAQCPVAGFVASDTVCINFPFPVNDTSTTGLNYQWDFCAGDLKKAPSGFQVDTFPTLLNPFGIDIVTDGVNWYGFVVNYGNNSIARFDFGNSLDNTPPPPTPVAVSGLNGPVEIKLINDNGYWYAIVSNSGDNTVLKLNMDSLTNTSPAAIALPSGVGFAGPSQSTIVKDHNNYIALVAMSGSNKIGIWDFGTSMATNPTPTFLAMPGTAPISLAVAKECNQWYGIVAYISDAIISRIKFGTSISNVINGIDTVATLLAGARDVEMSNDGGSWFAFVMDIGGANLTRLDFGPSLNSATVNSNSLGTLGGVFNGDYAFTLEKTGSKWYGFSDEYGTNIINKFLFPDSCSATLVTSTDFNPVNPSYTNYGTYNISLTVTDSLGNVSFFDDSVVVANPPQAGFNTGPACANSPVSFYDTSSGGGSIVSWLWYFGDGDSSVSQNPVHQYASATYYVVTLTVTSITGCTATITDSVFVQTSPDAGFIFPPGNK